MPKWVRRLRSRQDGVTAVEYALIAALIAVVIVAAVRAAGTATSSTFSQVAGEFNNQGH